MEKWDEHYNNEITALREKMRSDLEWFYTFDKTCFMEPLRNNVKLLNSLGLIDGNKLPSDDSKASDVVKEKIDALRAEIADAELNEQAKEVAHKILSFIIGGPINNVVTAEFITDKVKINGSLVVADVSHPVFRSAIRYLYENTKQITHSLMEVNSVVYKNINCINILIKPNDPLVWYKK